MVYRDVLVFLEGNAVQTGRKTEYTFYHPVQFEIRAKGFFVPIELLFFQLFRIVGPVPWHQGEVFSFQFLGDSGYFFHFLMGSRRIGFQQLVQQLVYIVAFFRHSTGQYKVGGGWETQQLGTFQTEVHQLLDNLHVVIFIVVGTLGVVRHI